MKTKIQNILLSILSLLLFACQDDFPGSGMAPVGEGEAELAVTLTYELETDVNLHSRAYEGGDRGDAIQNITTLHMLVYDEDGNLVKHYPVIDDDGSHDPDLRDVKNQDNQDNREEGSVSDDSKTGRVTFGLTLKSARYYIYGVANVKNFSTYADRFQTRDDLKNISFEWDAVTTENNSQMFGVFALGEPNRNQTDSHTIAVRRTDTQLWCYVKRLASKVTVAFDGSGLYDNVEIYVSKISIKDIAKKCALGVVNQPGLQADGTMADVADRYKIDNGLLPSGKSFVVQELPDNRVEIVPGTYKHVCNGAHCNLGAGSENADNDEVHSQEARALYFYENAQGIGKNKHQDADEDDKIDFPEGNNGNLADGWKDQKPYGTYIEVEGYYRCTLNDGKMGYGPIKYRFMMGQNVNDDYNAFRNNHYRLTLCFKGYGNDADWHIVYQEPTGIYSSSPQYISYVYLKDMTASVKVVGQMEGKLKAHIMGSDDADRKSWMTAEQIARDDSVLAEQTYWRPWGVKRSDSGVDHVTFPDPDYAMDVVTPTQAFYYKGSIPNDGPWNSFLSLKKVLKQRVEGPNQYDFATQDTGDEFLHGYNKQYWDDSKLGDREYLITPNNKNEVYKDEFGNYRVAASKSDPTTKVVTERVFSVPLYTRGNILVGRTGYLGNNPYESFPRKATVRFAAQVKDPDREGKTKWEIVYVDMIQVRRITNPKGICFSEENTNNVFHVTLTHLLTPDADKFTQVISDGAWSAEVWQGDGSAANNVIALSNTDAGIGEGSIKQTFVSRIEGDDEHPIDFNINILGPGFAIVKVRYHNYTCEHDIFVRKNYREPVDLTGTGLEWSSSNVVCFDGKTPVLADSPLDEGSMFKRGVYIGIKKENNEKYKQFEAPSGSFSVIMPDGSEADKTWSDLSWCNVDGKYKTSSFNNWTIDGGGRIASIDDYYKLISLDEYAVDFHIKRAYGIIYGDGMTKTEYDVQSAYGAKRDNGGANCMRGVFLYNNNNSKHIFMPLGATGYGRRKGNGGWQPTPKDVDGTMRYASRTRLYNWVSEGNYQAEDARLSWNPLFYDIYRRPGALYWCKERFLANELGSDGVSYPNSPDNQGGKLRASKSCALDINFHTMGFEGFLNGAAKKDAGEDSDACFIRTIGYTIPKNGSR